MPQHPRPLVACGVGLRERRTSEWIDRPRDIALEQHQLAAVNLEREHTWSLGELECPHVLRLWPRPEAGRSALVGLLMRCREQARQRGVLREGQNAPLGEE